MRPLTSSHRLHELGEIPYRTFSEIPAHKKYCYDEEGGNENGKLDPVIGSRSRIGELDTLQHTYVKHSSGKYKRSSEQGTARAYSQTTGDRSPFHVTRGVTTRADGALNIPLAVIHSQPGAKDSDSCRYTLDVVGNLDEDVLPYRTPNGSADQKYFAKFSHFFCKHLGRQDGLQADPVFLLLDGAIRIWTYQGLSHFRSQKVYVYCIPSHSSIWSQANDAGPNSSFKAAKGMVMQEWRKNNPFEVLNRLTFNKLLMDSWHKWKSSQATQLEQTGVNAISSAWRRVGLQPVNRYCESWSSAIATIGVAHSMAQGQQFEELCQFPSATGTSVGGTLERPLKIRKIVYDTMSKYWMRAQTSDQCSCGGQKASENTHEYHAEM